MSLKKAAFLLFAIAPWQGVCFSQQPSNAPADSHTVHLNVVVASKSGELVPNLTEQDFTILDNKQPSPIASFKIVNAAQEPVELILFLDAVNSGYESVAYGRQNMEKFLRSNEGKLAYPTTIALFGDKGTQIFKGFSTDGNSTSDALEKLPISLREINNTSEWGAVDRLQLSLKAIHQLLAYATTLPGRKIVLWVSPGWPLVSGPRVELTSKEQDQIFDEIVGFSTEMRQANVTIYDVNPLASAESLVQQNAYLEFLNGISKPGQVRFGNLALQVLATQSGGQSLQGSSDIAAMIAQCLADAKSWYEIEIAAPPEDKPNEYHHLEIKLDKPGLTARTRDSYYAKPTELARH